MEKKLILPNSIDSNVNQITVVTSTHPPVIIDNHVPQSPVTPPAASSKNEVVIVSNELNKTTHVHESSTDDDYPSLDSLETSSPLAKQSSTILVNKTNESQQQNNQNHSQKGAIARKLDESEVLIVSPSFVDEDSAYNTGASAGGSDNNLLDTSHVSVVTVTGEEVTNSHSDEDSTSECVSLKNKVNGEITQKQDDVNIIVNHKKALPGGECFVLFVLCFEGASTIEINARGNRKGFTS